MDLVKYHNGKPCGSGKKKPMGKKRKRRGGKKKR